MLGSILALCLLPCTGSARSRADKVNFGAARGLTFYTAPEIETLNSRLGNSPRLTAEHEFGRALTHSASFEFLNPTESLAWGVEGYQWAETLRGTATTGEETPRSEATAAFFRLWFSAGVRLWPWVGPVVLKRTSRIFGYKISQPKPRKLGAGFFSHVRLATGPLLWRHDYMLSDALNQTAINYASRTFSWDGGVRWSLGYRLGSFCDLGVDLIASRSLPVKGESGVGQYFLSGRDYSDQVSTLEVEKISRAQWRSSQALIFVRFFYP